MLAIAPMARGGTKMRMLTRVGSAPPNGSRLSCGRPARRRKGVGRQSVPARAQHSVSFRAIGARQLQALVRRRTRLVARSGSALWLVEDRTDKEVARARLSTTH